MKNPVVVQTSPEKSNLHFSVSEFTSIMESFGPFMKELKEKWELME